MGYFKYTPLIVVPASRVAAFNNVMQKHGYGDKFLDKSRRNAVIGINDDPLIKEPTHHFLTCNADEGLWAALCEALKKANSTLPDAEKGIRRQRFMREVTRKRIKNLLANAQLKRKSKEDEDAEEAAGVATVN